MSDSTPSPGSAAAPAHLERVARLATALRAAGGVQRVPIGIAKADSNLFRDRAPARKQRLDVGSLNHVLAVDSRAGRVETEAMVSYEALVGATLAHGTMPAVVPQLKSITIGGALAGVGIEATSFRHGLVHDTICAFDVLLPSGDVVACTPTNTHSDLFYGFPNSYGTLGYAVRIEAATIPVRPFVRVEHQRFGNAGDFFAALSHACDGDADFVDGVVFGAGELVLNRARFVDEASSVSDYGFEHIYYRSLLEKPLDCLRVADYLWRWDTDWFWCSKNLGAQHPLIRRLYGRRRLNSRTYTRLMRLNSRLGITRTLARLRGRHPESVIQDVDIPIARAGEFLEFLLREIGIVPVWICPIRPARADKTFALYPLAPGVRYVNFGFWDVVDARHAHEPGHYNRLVEEQVLALAGIKSLYSESYFERGQFDRAYGGESYAKLKSRYDPQHRLLGLYREVRAAGLSKRPRRRSRP